MAWTAEHRRAADRRGLRYPSDLTDAEWALVAPLIRPAKHGGRPRKVDVREVLNAVFYVLSTGCQWSALPKDLPPKSTVWDYFSRWEWEGTIERIHHVLYVAVREQAGREASPTTAIIDSQTAKAAQKGALRSTRPAMTRARKSSAALEQQARGDAVEPGDGGDRHAGLHGLLDQPNLLLGSVASAAFAAGDDFNALDGLRHRRIPRLPPRPSRWRRLSGRIGGRSRS